MEKEWGGETLGEARLELGAEREMVLFGGGIMWAMVLGSIIPAAAAWATAAAFCLLPLRELGLLWMRECLVSSSERLKRLEQPGKVQAWGFSPVWVRM